MRFINTLKERLPDYAKDIRLNLDAVIGRSSLAPAAAAGTALAAAFAAKSAPIMEAIRTDGTLDTQHQEAPLTAAALMGMNQDWYPFVRMAGRCELKTIPA